MGAWGTGPFDNDDAADLAGSLDDLEPEDKPAAIREALLEAAEETDYLERDAGGAAVAAAALVAAQQPDGDTIDTISGPKQSIPDLPEDLRALAVQALTRVLAEDSELNELWTDSPDGDEWFTMIAQLMEILTAT
ncbi:MAG TPA: DUF4259 domain-containing protein [Pseudonocardiaceae bacterium]|jgi:hypothetical protein|nr:DUF4259 domain-containing protein [Pseudonocardiaceae bacterium]